MSTQIEVWLRGPIDGVVAAFMPAAHALMQTVEDVERAVADLSPEQLWLEPGGAASIGFHLVHLVGSTDRLLTYARGERLNDAQKSALADEKSLPRTDLATLVANLKRGFDAGLAQIKATPVETISDARAIGRAALPSTVGGLIFHAAEHSQRHAGQVVTTAKIVRGLAAAGPLPR